MTRNLASKDNAGEVVALNCYVRDKIRYVRDIIDCETLQTPQNTMLWGAGDCDDKAILLASLLMSIGYEVRFACLNQGKGWCHVWTQVRLSDKDWISLEPTEPVDTGISVKITPSDTIMIWKVT